MFRTHPLRSPEEFEGGGFGEPTGDTSGIDADALMSAVESGSEIPSAQPAATPAAAPTAAQEIAFKWNGKEIKAPITDPRVSQWASQGYDYAQKMQAFQAQQTEFQQQQAALREMESKYSPYSKVDEYFQANPDKWAIIQAQIQGGAANPALDPNNPLNQKLQGFEKTLSETQQYIQQQIQEKVSQERTKEDQALNEEIQSIRDNFKDLDWGSADAEGKNLEYKVLEHARTIGTKSFRAAFRDFYHDQLTQRAEQLGKESVVKERQAKTKLGLLGQSPTPKKGIQPADDHKNKSYDQLFAEGLAELQSG